MAPQVQDKVAELVRLAGQLVEADPTFRDVKGPGAGDHSTAALMKNLRELALQAFGENHSEKKICGRTAYAVDFYFEDQAAIVEIALGLPNPSTEFEKDILKAIIAKELGNAVERLVFISRPGAVQKCNQPGRSAVKAWAESKHGIKIQIYDLPGKPRELRRRGRNRQTDA